MAGRTVPGLPGRWVRCGATSAPIPPPPHPAPPQGANPGFGPHVGALVAANSEYDITPASGREGKSGWVVVSEPA